MSILTVIGIILGAFVIMTDRYIRPLPHWLAVTAYTIACALFIAGMILARCTKD